MEILRDHPTYSSQSKSTELRKGIVEIVKELLTEKTEKNKTFDQNMKQLIKACLLRNEENKVPLIKKNWTAKVSGL